MFDAVVFSRADPAPAARTLAGLVDGVIEGMVGRALLVSAETGDGLNELAEASGCRFAPDVAPARLPEVLATHLQSQHVMAFEAGALLPPDWPALLRAELQRRGEPPTGASFVFRPERLADRLRLTAEVGAFRRIPLGHGALLPRQHLIDPRYRGGPVMRSGPVSMIRLPVGRAGER